MTDTADLSDVAVVIPTRGHDPGRLRRLIIHLAAETALSPARPEIIVADNAGDGRIATAMTRSRLTTGRFVIVPAFARPGKAYAVNHAVRTSTTRDVILLLDDDDVPCGGYLRGMAAATRAHGYAGGRLRISRNPPHVRDRRTPLQDTCLPTWGGHEYAIGASCGITRGLYLEVGGYDEDLPALEDVDLGYRLGHTRLVERPWFARDVYVNYTYRQDVNSTFRQELGYGAGEACLWRKHRRTVGRRPARQVAAVAAALARGLPDLSPAGRIRTAGRAGQLAGQILG